MAIQISDVEYITRILDNMKGQSNVRTARKIAILFGGRIRQRVRDRDHRVKDDGDDGKVAEFQHSEENRSGQPGNEK